MPEIVTTEDGSITCLDKGTGELYHNRAGAYTEALRNYVEPCALPQVVARQTNLRIFDVCFGLGYNSFVFLQQLLKLIEQQASTADKFYLHMIGLDRDFKILEIIPKILLSPKFDSLAQLRQASFLNSLEAIKGSFCQVFPLGQHERLIVKFEFRLADLRHELPKLVLQSEQSFDFIFHDGFSPRRMPELWSIDLFARYVRLLKPEGKILTYSSATAVRGALRSLGLSLGRTAALGGKSGGTVASRQDYSGQLGLISALRPEEEKRLQSPSAVPYRDPGLSDSGRQILLRREQEIACLRSKSIS